MTSWEGFCIVIFPDNPTLQIFVLEYLADSLCILQIACVFRGGLCISQTVHVSCFRSEMFED